MRTWCRCGLVLALLAVLPLQAVAADGQLEKAFAPGQRVSMDLSAGDYTILAGRDDRVRVRWETDDPDAGEIHVSIDIRGTEASIVTWGDSKVYSVTIELPAVTSITTRLSAGDLRIREITGDKDVHSWAGDITIEVGRPEAYRTVSASVQAGDITALPFDVSKGGLFRSFSWDGPGTYTLRVKLTAGDLTLRNGGR
jgi:hypothetical protein